MCVCVGDRLGKLMEANYPGAMEDMGVVIPSEDMDVDSHRSSQSINRAVCMCVRIDSSLTC